MAKKKPRKKTSKKAKRRVSPSKRKGKKKTVRKRAKAAKRKTKGSKRAQAKAPKQQVIGIVTHYFPHVQAAVIKLKKPLAIGDRIRIKGSTTDFQQQVESMQIDHAPITQAKKGDEIGLQVSDRVREHDLILVPS